MRYLGNKTKLLSFIDHVIDKYNIEGETFADIFAGTASVADHFKDRYRIIANDYMSFSSALCKAKLFNGKKPGFKLFKKKYGVDPFEWLNKKNYQPSKDYFIYNNYTPVGGRMYFTEENAIRIDGMRLDIEEMYKQGLFSEAEYAYMIASLLESTLRVSNTSGTYQAFFKFWENRSQKVLWLEPLEFNEVDMKGGNIVFNHDANMLVREIEGDIAYIDPPYTITQYANSYHLLETITKYDYPVIFGKTGRRKNRTLSGYSNKSNAIFEFEDLFRQINFDHVLVSYSNQSIVPLSDLIELARKFAINGEVYVETSDYKEYATNNLSYKGTEDGLKEAIIYFKKDRSINKSPLNYSGSKDVVLPMIMKQLPKHVGTFVDAMGGAFNVGANIVATDKVYYIEYNKYVYGIVNMLVNTPKTKMLEDVETVVKQYHLKKKDREAYLNLRTAYNNEPDNSLYLFVLQIYAFQNMIRYNSSQQMNTPVGNNEYSDGIRERIKQFDVKTKEFELVLGRYEDTDLSCFPKDTVFYFDPPYFITNAEYNDGKRGLDGWDAEKENELLSYLSKLNSMGYKFMLSNVLKHNGKTHHMLVDWIEHHKLNVITIGRTGIKYPREEVVITNYDI